MASVILSYIMPLLLGRTIDLSSYTLGGDIYDATQYTEHPLMTVNSAYTILPMHGFPYSQLNLPIDLILRFKARSLSSGSDALALEQLLHDMVPHPKSVSIALVTTVQTVQRKLKKDARLVPNWKSLIEDHQTHYVNSVTYGGWSVVFYRFTCDIPAETEIVRRILTSVLKPTGNVNEDTEALWKKAVEAVTRSKDLNGKISVQTRMYSNIPQSEDITPDNFLQVISKLKDAVGSKGRPLFVELRPLYKLDEKYPVMRENHDLDRELVVLDFMFDDLKTTKKHLYKWMERTLTEFSDKEELKIQALLDEVTRITRFFHLLSSDASIYTPMNRKFLRLGFAMYNEGLKKHKGTYKDLYNRLREDLDPECENRFRPKVLGMLKTTDKERQEIENVNGVKECKALCTNDKKCRAIGYVTAPSNKMSPTNQKRCILYFRSTSTAPVVVGKDETTFYVYDRKCNIF